MRRPCGPRRFYENLGWRLDADIVRADGSRAVPLTPPGSPTSIHLGTGPALPRFLIVNDIEAARADLMREVAQITGTKEENIWVYLCNLAPTDMVEYGHVLPQPGEEAAWYDRLPKPLRDYLANLGTTKETFTL